MSYVVPFEEDNQEHGVLERPAPRTLPDSTLQLCVDCDREGDIDLSDFAVLQIARQYRTVAAYKRGSFHWLRFLILPAYASDLRRKPMLDWNMRSVSAGGRVSSSASMSARLARHIGQATTSRWNWV